MVGIVTPQNLNFGTTKTNRGALRMIKIVHQENTLLLTIYAMNNNIAKMWELNYKSKIIVGDFILIPSTDRTI